MMPCIESFGATTFVPFDIAKLRATGRRLSPKTGWNYDLQQPAV